MIGIDEVGRGCWAGPLLVVAARQKNALSPLIADSKCLSRSKRLSLMNEIKESCEIGEGWVSVAELDAQGLASAMRLGVERALQAIGAVTTETIVLDGSINYCDSRFTNVSAIVKADQTVTIVSAASIYAKVTRDNFMTNLPADYQRYEFASHVGYGTKNHLALLIKHGVSDLHRRSFRPIKALL